MNYLQCLEVIKKGLADPRSSQATRVSLVQRAHRVLQSKAVTATKVATKRRTRKVCDADSATADSAAASPRDASIWRYTLDDFPNEDVVTASEVLACMCKNWPLGVGGVK